MYKIHIYVTEEYSSYVFNTLYGNEGIPFCNYLLETYEELLKKIVLDYLRIFPPFFEYGIKLLGKSCCFGVAQKGFATDDNFSFSSDDMWNDYIQFSEFKMSALNSVGQQYGMALALIQTIKDCYPEFEDSVCTMHIEQILTQNPIGGYIIQVRLKMPATPIKLKEW